MAASSILRHIDTHNDLHGDIGTALSGVTQWTPTAYRSTKVVLNEVASGDVFSFNVQMSHDKKLGSALDSLHIHFVPKAAQNGDIAFTYAWGMFNVDEVIPITLPNTGTVADITLATTDQFKHKLSVLIANMAAPTAETYSAQLLVELTAVAPADGTNWWTAGGTNRIAILDIDAHYISDRFGSVNEATD